MISECALQWKLNFNIDSSKQVQEFIFSRKIKPINYLLIFFNLNLVSSTCKQNHVGLVLDAKLDFKIHLKNLYNRVSKTKGLLHKLHSNFSRASLINNNC